MSDMSRRPRVLKGALIGLDPLDPIASVVIFQYNPNTVQRTVRPRVASRGGARDEIQRLAGAPQQSLSLEVHVNAADQLERADPIAVASGIHPQLAALEMLVTPKLASVIANQALMATGSLEIIPPEAPLTLFVWGTKRVVPVQVESLSITEKAFDTMLNPILADVDLSLRVLTYDDYPLDHPGFSLSLVHQATKEALAQVGAVVNTGNAI